MGGPSRTSAVKLPVRIPHNQVPGNYILKKKPLKNLKEGYHFQSYNVIRVARARRRRAPPSPPPWPRLSRRAARARRPRITGLGRARRPAVVLVSCLDPHHNFEIGRWLVTAWAGPAFVRWAVREKRGQIHCAPEVLEIINRYNENDHGVSKRVHELAFGFVTVICFES